MVDWDKRKRFFDDWFFDFNKMDKIMDELMKDFFEGEATGKPIVFGFSMKQGPEGKPIIEEFGNLKRVQGKPAIVNAREPLVDVNKAEGGVTITAELPGVNKNDIVVSGRDKHTVEIMARGQTPFYKKLQFKETLKPGSAKAKFNNGILEVKIKTNEQKKGDEIKVE